MSWQSLPALFSVQPKDLMAYRVRRGVNIFEYCIHATRRSPYVSAQPPVWPKGHCQIWRNSIRIMSQYFAHPPVCPQPGQKCAARLRAWIQYYVYASQWPKPLLNKRGWIELNWIDQHCRKICYSLSIVTKMDENFDSFYQICGILSQKWYIVSSIPSAVKWPKFHFAHMFAEVG